MRTIRAVFRDHLQQALQELPCSDICSLFSEDCVLVTCFGTFHGHEGVRQSAILLEEYLPNARYNYEECIREGELCFLGWSAEADDVRVDDGADSFLIQDGTIRVMTISYTKVPAS